MYDFLDKIGLKTALEQIKAKFPSSLPANGGNADYAANADKLDGLHAEGFIKTNSSDAYDCNTLYDAGLYLCNGSATNTPNDLKYGTLFVMPYRKPYGNASMGYCAQIFIPNGDAVDTSMWYRTSLQNTWNEWKRSCDGGNADTVDGLHASDFIKNTSDWKPMNFEITYGDHNYPNVIDNNIPIMPKTCNYTHIISRVRSDNSIISILSIPSDYDDDIFLYQSISGVWKNIADGGNADTLDGLHANDFYTSENKPYVTGSVSISYSTESQNFEFLNFTPSAVICRYASRYENDGTIKWATPITNGFKVDVSSTEAKSLDYIAFR